MKVQQGNEVGLQVSSVRNGVVWTHGECICRLRLGKRGRGCDGGFRGEGRSNPSSFARVVEESDRQTCRFSWSFVLSIFIVSKIVPWRTLVNEQTNPESWSQKNIRFGRAGSCPAIKKSKSFNVVVRHSRDMDIVDADKLLIYEICHHYLAFDTDGNFFS